MWVLIQATAVSRVNETKVFSRVANLTGTATPAAESPEAEARPATGTTLIRARAGIEVKEVLKIFSTDRLRLPGSSSDPGRRVALGRFCPPGECEAGGNWSRWGPGRRSHHLACTSRRSKLPVK